MQHFSSNLLNQHISVIAVNNSNWFEHCYSIYQDSCQRLYLIFKFQIGSIAKNVLHDKYYYYANVHAFTTFWSIFSRITWTIEDIYEADGLNTIHVTKSISKSLDSLCEQLFAFYK